MKSLFSGALLGLLTGGIAVGAASVIAPQPAGNTPPAAPLVEAPQAAGETPDPIDPTPPAAETAAPTAGVQAPQGLDADATASLPETDTTPPDVPDASDLATDLEVPAQSAATDIAVNAEEPVLPNPQSVAPQVPAAEQELVISTEPAAVPEPVLVEDSDADVVVPAPAQEAPAPVIVVQEPVVEDLPETAPAADTETAELAPPDASFDAPAGVLGTESPDVPAEIAETPALDAPADSDRGPVVVGGVDTSADPDSEAAPSVIVVGEDTGSTLPQGVTDIPVNRVTGGLEEDTAEAPASEAAPVDPDAPAIDQYKAAFDNAEGKPTMSIILLDEGQLDGAAQALADVPFPVTVVLDPTRPGVSDAMAAYRAAGLEVAVLAALPAGARPSDVEVTFGAAFGALPESVALVDPGEGNLQGDRAVMAQAMAALAEDGRGLVTISRGLNTGVQAAEDAGVPTGLIFRDLDSQGQDARAVSRFLDQAAFRARQEPGVILLGRMRAETLDALSSWGEANRAGQVAMAPVSAVLGAK